MKHQTLVLENPIRFSEEVSYSSNCIPLVNNAATTQTTILLSHFVQFGSPIFIKAKVT